MPRTYRNTKPLIYVFCEGESEQAYVHFLKQEFREKAVIKDIKGLFSDALDKFRKEPRYKENIDVTDEIWFFFDVEEQERPQIEKRFQIISTLRKLRKKPNIRVRLLMTTACVEYWFLLHYEKLAPSLATTADKQKMLQQLQAKMPGYRKGDMDTIHKIAENYPLAIQHGQWSLGRLTQEGLPSLQDTDERNKWLCRCGLTFTTVQEALLYLKSL